MTQSRRLRKLSLTAHVVFSVGWLGAVICSCVVAVVALTSSDLQLVRSAYVTLEVIGLYALIPLSIASLISGIVQSLSTRWGLFRHYWVIAKLVINVVATAVLLLYTQTLDHLADLAATSAGLNELRSASPVLHASAAIVMLVIATGLAFYKPNGLTKYGYKKQQRTA